MLQNCATSSRTRMLLQPAQPIAFQPLVSTSRRSRARIPSGKVAALKVCLFNAQRGRRRSRWHANCRKLEETKVVSQACCLWKRDQRVASCC
jgi:hypothetical protein